MDLASIWVLVLQSGYQFISGVLVSSGCCNKYHRLGGFLTVLETGKSKVKALADLLSGEAPLPDLQTASLLHPYTERGGGANTLGSSYKGTNPIMRPHPHDFI